VVEKMNVFDFAMKIEEESRDRYEKLAAVAGSDDVKRIFTLLADSEQEHYKHLELLKAGTDTRNSESTLLERSRDQIRELVDSLDPDTVLLSDSDGYRHAVKAEEGSIELYEQMAAQEPNQAAATLLRTIAEEEQLHLQVIESIYDFVESPRTYLEWGEFSNLRDY
jgi:rubrerythrin